MRPAAQVSRTRAPARAARTRRARGRDRAGAFHRRLPGYAATPRRRRARPGAGARARRARGSRTSRAGSGCRRSRSSARRGRSYRLLVDRLGTRARAGRPSTTCAPRSPPLGPLTLVAATDGNHGRAVAHMARLLGYASPHPRPRRHRRPPASTGIEREGATVTVVDGTYDDAVAAVGRARGRRRARGVGHVVGRATPTCPRDVIEGYTTIFAEVDEQLARRRARRGRRADGRRRARPPRSSRTTRHAPTVVAVEPLSRRVRPALGRGRPCRSTCPGPTTRSWPGSTAARCR